VVGFGVAGVEIELASIQLLEESRLEPAAQVYVVGLAIAGVDAPVGPTTCAVSLMVPPNVADPDVETVIETTGIKLCTPTVTALETAVK
jgi:hypothetical protein